MKTYTVTLWRVLTNDAIVENEVFNGRNSLTAQIYEIQVEALSEISANGVAKTLFPYSVLKSCVVENIALTNDELLKIVMRANANIENIKKEQIHPLKMKVAKALGAMQPTYPIGLKLGYTHGKCKLVEIVSAIAKLKGYSEVVFTYNTKPIKANGQWAKDVVQISDETIARCLKLHGPQ